MPELRLRRLPDRTPVKIAVDLSPELHQALQDYAAARARGRRMSRPAPADERAMPLGALRAATAGLLRGGGRSPTGSGQPVRAVRRTAMPKRQSSGRSPTPAQQITAAMIEKLGQGTKPWVRPWRGVPVSRPLRACGTPYRGMNVFGLWMVADGRILLAVSEVPRPRSIGGNWHIQGVTPSRFLAQAGKRESVTGMPKSADPI